jgi:hypothetical protein
MKDRGRVLGNLCLVTMLLGLSLALLPVATLTPAAYAQPCAELLVNGNMETNAGWQLGPSPVTPQYVTFSYHSPNRSLLLGITSGANVESFSSARQTVTLPAGASQITINFWFFAMADGAPTTDYMELVLLNATGTAILNKPWISHNDSRAWNQLSFDLTPWRGQTVQVYFNVFNDGLGGRAAMFLDDVSLNACPGASTITPTGTVVTPGPTSTPTVTLIPPTVSPCVNLLLNSDFTAGLTPWQTPGDISAIRLVTNPVVSPPNAVQLGLTSLDLNRSSIANLRQQVAVPTSYSTITLEASVYTESQPASADGDFQQIAILDAAGNPLPALWSGKFDNRAWQQLSFPINWTRGTTISVNFAVNNDGFGSRTMMVVDDVRLMACNPGLATATATLPPTLTPTGTQPPPIITPTPTLTSPPGTGCIQLLTNNGFEAGLWPWQPGNNPLPAQLVPSPVLSGAFSLGLGALNQNLNSYSSVRQWVTVPATHPTIWVSFWEFTRAESLWGGDSQQFVVLGPGDAVLAVPWKVLQNTQIWQPQQFILNGLAGQNIAPYFNAINDGKGGRTSLFVDEVYLWACAPGFSPTIPMPLLAPGAATGASGAASVQVAAITPAAASAFTVEQAAAVTPAQPERALAAQAGTLTPEVTVVALRQPTLVAAAREVQASVTPMTAAAPSAVPTVPASGNLIDRIKQWPAGWLLAVLAFIALAVVAYLLFDRASNGQPWLVWALLVIALIIVIIVLIRR